MAVYRLKHFAKAADDCNVTQPTLSSMIQKLEDELGVKIFDRKRQPIQPTQAGMKVIEEAWKVLNRAKKLRQTIDEERQTLTGTFEVAVLPTIAPYLIPRFFPQLMNEHPRDGCENHGDEDRRHAQSTSKGYYRCWYISTG